VKIIMTKTDAIIDFVTMEPNEPSLSMTQLSDPFEGNGMTTGDEELRKGIMSMQPRQRTK
jgi:hypothetical protein